MNLRQVECFLAVVEELHFRRAAERLGLAPASVSEAVSGLERSLGGRLVERTSRRVALTPLGAEFAAAVRQPLEDLRRAHRVARVRAAHRRDVVVAHTPELGQLLLTPLAGVDPHQDGGALPPWRAVAMHTREQLTAIADGDVDIGLCWSVPDQPALTSVVLGEYPLVAVLRSSDPLARQPEVRLVQLRSRQLLVTPSTDNPYLASQLQADLTRAGIARSSLEEVDRYDELAVQVATRGHVGLHPGPIALTSTMPTVVFRPVADTADRVRICAVSLAEARARPIAAVVAALATIVAALDVAAALSRPA